MRAEMSTVEAHGLETCSGRARAAEPESPKARSHFSRPDQAREKILGLSGRTGRGLGPARKARGPARYPKSPARPGLTFQPASKKIMIKWGKNIF